ncbi:MAG TPA: HD domain-containing protein [Nitrospiria bacterium]|nr:HD domain-containing protein [Nitrospiria bacterium]
MYKGSLYEGHALIADPIHEYITFTVPYPDPQPEITEKQLIDSPWVQRLRYIYQLQSARWVFPSAEHSRFQHSIGAMHVAGRFARHLYASLTEIVPDCPSENFIEELLRVTALVHDIGHGPFGHFFDDNFLAQYGITHEILGQYIIRDELGSLIRRIRRSPSGPFGRGEEINPDHVAFLILKDPQKNSAKYPPWLVFLQPILGGIYTADNMDYVLRDSYMCGVAVGPVDIRRLIHYTFFTDKGLTLHKTGLSALQMFLNTRLYLYSNVYYHRTTRAIDLHLRDIFHDTIRRIFPYHPIKRRSEYLQLTEWSLLEEIRRWKRSSDAKKRKLYDEWQLIFHRDVKWKMAYDITLPTRGGERGRTFLEQETVERRIREQLPASLKKLPFKVDMANQDPRPLNPLSMGEFQIYVYDPSTKVVSKEILREYFDFIPAKIVQCRIFTLNHEHDAEMARAAERVLGTEAPSSPTNL